MNPVNQKDAFDGEVRRIDLHLRTKHPYLTTRIFKFHWASFSIYVEDFVSNFEELSEEFDKGIRFITVPVKLCSEIPSSFTSELPIIEDKDIPSNFEGLPMNHNDLVNFIHSKHPNISLLSVKPDHENQKIITQISKYTPDIEVEGLQKTLDFLKIPYDFELVKSDAPKTENFAKDDVNYIAAAKSKKGYNLPFIEEEEHFWFENLENIYNGNLKKTDLSFFEKDKTSCFLSFSPFSNVNIRNHLLLYDTVYCVLPLMENMPSFLEEQKIDRNELLSLVETGRLKVVNTQPEGRMDFGFLREIYETNKNSMISRLGISALCAVDLVEMNDSYIFNSPEARKMILPLAKAVEDIFKKPVNQTLQMLLWPQQALRSSFEVLNGSGPFSIATYGVNKIALDMFPDQENNALEFEFNVNSSSIHVAHALDATYFPFIVKGDPYTDHFYATIMGNLLNSYKNATIPNLASMSDIMSTTNATLDLIDVFEVNDFATIEEFETIVKSQNLRAGMHSLFTELSGLSSEERSDAINSYNADLRKMEGYQNTGKHALDFTIDAAGIIIPLLGSAIKITQLLGNKAADKYPKLREFAENIEEKATSTAMKKSNLSLLSKVSRVARLRAKRK